MTFHSDFPKKSDINLMLKKFMNNKVFLIQSVMNFNYINANF